MRHVCGLIVALLLGLPPAASGETEPGEQPPVAAWASDPIWGPMELLGEQVAPGERRDLFLPASESFSGSSVTIRVAVLRGERPGLALCLTSAVHGDELNGVEIVRRVIHALDPEKLAGTLIAVPIVNVHGFRRSSRYLPDRRDLNRFFPGNATGSSASRIAAALFENVVRRCDAMVDFHTGSFHRTNIPQVRADLRNAAVAHLAKGFGAAIAVHSEGHAGTLRRAATRAGVPTITYEAGQPMRFETPEIVRGVEGLESLLRFLDMVGERGDDEGEGEEAFYESHWVRVEDGGILLTDVPLGETVEAGELLGSIIDPETNVRTQVLSPYAGRVIGMAFPQVVMPGFAAFHIGMQGTHPGPEGPPPSLLLGIEAPEEKGDVLEPEEHPE